MNSQYGYVADHTVVEFFSFVTSRERSELLGVFDSLTRDPFQRSSYLQKTLEGRELQVKRFGRWLVTYWLDQPVKEMRIVDVVRVIP